MSKRKGREVILRAPLLIVTSPPKDVLEWEPRTGVIDGTGTDDGEVIMIFNLPNGQYIIYTIKDRYTGAIVGRLQVL
ncbi:MAG: hypothetical protein ACTSYM_08645 [Candidatus Baldrarchaeia archaeon]